MKLSEVCIKRPVLAWVFTLIILLLGLVTFSRLPLQKLPKMSSPFLAIEAHQQGAAPEIVESQITRVLEESFAGIEGLVTMQSTSGVEDSKIYLEFVSTRRIDDAANDVRDRISKVRDKLPKDIQDPVINKSKQDDTPIINLALLSQTKSPNELAEFARKDIQKELESLAGVARVEVIGAGLYKMRLKLDPARLAAYKISVSDVVTAVKQQNVEQPAGKLESKEREYLVTTLSSMEQPEEFEQLIVSAKEGHLVRIKDLGTVEMTADDKRTRTTINGKKGIAIAIYKQADANPIDVARLVKNSMPTLQERVPPEMVLTVSIDYTKYIEDYIKRLYQTIGEAILLVILVVFAFLRSGRASIIPIVTIPVSLIGALFLMYLADFSINTMTLLAMVLAIGLVVDDAIVVLENIHRRIEDGMKAMDAAITGIREISFAVIAMTITLVAVYAPIALVKGTTGKYFTEFAITLAGAVLLSGFVALTLSPMMCSRLLKSHHIPKTEELTRDTFWQKIKHIFGSDYWLVWIEEHYKDLLERALAPLNKVQSRRFLVLGAFSVTGIVGLMIYGMVQLLPGEMLPKEDTGRIRIRAQAIQSATLDHTDRYIKQMDDIIKSIPEVEMRDAQIKNPTADLNIILKNDKTRSTESIQDELNTRFREISGIQATVRGSGTEDNADTIEYVVMSNKSHRELAMISSRVGGIIRDEKNIAQMILSNNLPDTMDYTLAINRDKVNALKIDPKTIADTIETLLRGRKAGTFKKENVLYDVMVEVKDEARQTPHDITNLFVKAGDKEGTLVPLSELVTVYTRAGPMDIFHYNRMRAFQSTVKLSHGVDMASAIEATKDAAKETLTTGSQLQFFGETKKYIEERSSIALIFVLALSFIYLVMAAQFESWVDPFIIILTVPLAILGALVTLSFTEVGSLNLYSYVGLATLIGLITKHGILMVDFANKLRDQGLSIYEAIIESSQLRLRPILMTTFAMVFGSLPMALASGTAHEHLNPIGWVVVGGMTFGTIMTLLVLPMAYIIFTRRVRTQGVFEGLSEV